MATYKVIQDIEAEDKFVGPLTLKQFIFAAITVVCGYISFLFITKHVWFLAVPLFPVIVAGGFLAFPWGRDQPTETWLLARISFFFKPRRRVWDQSGIQELVTITAPKKVEAQYTSNNLSQIEVRSRLKALANTIDSHGWAVKNVNVNLSTQPAYIQQNIGSDRLVATEDVPMDVPIVDIQASDDMLDAKNNPTAQKLDQMIAESAENRRKEMLEHMQQVREGVAEQTSNRQTDGGEQSAADYWFMDQPDPEKVPAGYMTFGTHPLKRDDPLLPKAIVRPTGKSSGTARKPTELSPEEKALLEKVHKDQATPQPPAYGHMHVIQPLSAKKSKKKTKAPMRAQATSMTQTPDPDILELAINNDRDVASLAREATANRKKDPPDEVVISLH